MVKRIYFLIFLLVLPAMAFSQNIDFDLKNFPDPQIFRQIKMEFRHGDFYFNEADYANALKHYENLYRINPNNALLNYKIGICYVNLYPRSRAVEYLERAILLNPSEGIYLYELANTYRLNYEFEKAINTYSKYRVSLSDKLSEEEDKVISKRIEECHYAREKVQNPEPLRIENMGSAINSPYPEYCPIITADESVLIFTSRRPNTTGGKFDPKNPGYYEDIYVSYNIDDKWTKAYNPGQPLNTKYHDAVAGLSNDGQRLLTYRGVRGGGIYESKLEGVAWSKPLKFPKPINSKFHEPSASFSSTDRTIYFISNRPGGYGGSDIYLSHFSEETGWSQPENLGPVINTTEDEIAVFMHPDGKTLYFSSRGHKGMGGYDIFRSTLTEGQWTEPQNLGYPVNTPDDDVYFSITADNKHAYFSSAREKGMGGQDIYRVSFFGYDKNLYAASEDQLIAVKAGTHTETNLQALLPDASGMMILLKGAVLDETTNKPLTANIELVDNARNEVIATFTSNSRTGRFLVSLPSGKNYGIALRAEGYLFHSENFNIPNLREFKEIEKDIHLKKIEIGKEIALFNVFFDYREYKLRKESMTELDRLFSLMMEYPTLVIEISGHTDNIGTSEFNKELSVQRAKSVVDYLIGKGIDKNRLKYVGYGFEKPIAPNDTQEGRQRNRRSEFRVMER